MHASIIELYATANPYLGARYLAMNGIVRYTVERALSGRWEVFAETRHAGSRIGFPECEYRTKREAAAAAARCQAAATLCRLSDASA
jgi:hypothetical protein